MKMYIEVRFAIMYTKTRAVFSPLGVFLHYYLLPSLALASVVIFARSHKDGYSVNDIRVTYILFFCTAAQELYIYGPSISWASCFGLAKIVLEHILADGCRSRLTRLPSTTCCPTVLATGNPPF